MSSMKELQGDIGVWAQERLGNNQSKVDPGLILLSLAPLLGICEEIGELQGLTLKHHQGRSGYGPSPEGIKKYMSDRNDAVADIMVFLSDYCCREEIDLVQVTEDTFNKVVSKRTRENWLEHAHDETTTLEEDLGPTDINVNAKRPNHYRDLTRDNIKEREEQNQEEEKRPYESYRCINCNAKVNDKVAERLVELHKLTPEQQRYHCPDCGLLLESRNKLK